MDGPAVTCGGPGGGRRLLAYGWQVAALTWPSARAGNTARTAGGAPVAESAGPAARTSANVASVEASTPSHDALPGRDMPLSRSRSRRPGRDRALTGTPRAGGS